MVDEQKRPPHGRSPARWLLALPYALLCAVIAFLIASAAADLLDPGLPFSHDTIATVLVVALILVAAWFMQAAVDAAWNYWQRRRSAS